MFQKMSESIACFLCTKEEDREVYTYGAFVLLMAVFDVVELLIISVLIHHILEGFIYLGVLMGLRSYTGGYHATTFWKCNLMTVGWYLLNIFLAKGILLLPHHEVVSIGLLTMVTFLVVCKAPIENENKVLNEKEKKHYRKVSILCTLLLFAVVIALYPIYTEIMVYLVSCMVMVGTMMLQGLRKVKKNENSKRNNEKNIG